MKYKVEITELADHFVVVFKEKDTLKVKKVMSLNKLGTDILRAFMEGKTQDELVPLLAERYDTTHDEMKEQVSNFYSELAAY